MIRIIAGKHKNRLIPTIKKSEYRPSTSKFRMAVFSILFSGEFKTTEQLSSIKALDLFCGSGSLGFEALSRGIGSVTFIDTNVKALQAARGFASLIGELDNTSFLNMNALNLPKAQYNYDLIFIDPPYHKSLVPKAIESLINSNWLAQKSILVIELAKTDNFSLPSNIELITKRIYGNNKLLLLKYSAS